MCGFSRTIPGQKTSWLHMAFLGFPMLMLGCYMLRIRKLPLSSTVFLFHFSIFIILPFEVTLKVKVTTASLKRKKCYCMGFLWIMYILRIYLMFCWPCIIVYQYNKINVMHFSFSLLRIKGLYMFRALLAHPQEALHKRNLVYCVRRLAVARLQWNCNRATAHWHYKHAMYQMPVV
jgi:hypothetical protein